MTKMSDHTSDLLSALTASAATVSASQARDSDHQPAATGIGPAPTCNFGYTITAERDSVLCFGSKATEDRWSWCRSVAIGKQAARQWRQAGWTNVQIWNADGSPATAAPATAAPAAPPATPAPALLLLTDQRPVATRQRALLAALRARNAPRSVTPPTPEEVEYEVRASIAMVRRDRKPTPAAPAAPPAPTVERPFFALFAPVRAATAAPPPPPPPAAPFPGSQRNRPPAVGDLFAAQPTGGNPYAVALLHGSDLFHGTPASPQTAKATQCKRWFLLNEADKFFSRGGEFLHHRSYAFAYRNRDAAAFVASRLPASLGRVRVETR